ncbi:MAG: DUF6400 family protein [Pseudonocardiaceae bacterium]
MPAKTPNGPSAKPGADFTSFVVDLTAHEVRRVSAVLDAMPDWDPAAVLAAETQAHTLLYSGLNTEQLALRDVLRAEGALDARP